MAIVRPFRALRPTEQLVSHVACLPYDVISSEEARTMAKDNPLSFLHVAKSEIDLDPSTHPYDEKVYAKAEENLKKLIAEKVLVLDEKESLYIYKQVMGSHEQAGLLCCLSIDDYDNDTIKKHELTRQDKEEDRTKHICRLNANTGLVFLTYRNQKGIDLLIERSMEGKPLFDFIRDDGIRHAVWRIDDAQMIGQIVDSFATMKTLYVADGHHRSAAASKARVLKRKENANHTGNEEYNYFLGVLVPDNQVQIMSYNRIVRDLHGYSVDQFLTKVREKGFEAEKSRGNVPYAPERRHQFGAYAEETWYKLAFHEDLVKKDDPVESLDAQILQKNLLSSILGIDDPRTNSRIDFIGGIRGLGELMKRVDAEEDGMAFSLYPTSVEELMRIADVGKIMPPKSTWFEPKLLSGLIMHLLK